MANRICTKHYSFRWARVVCRCDHYNVRYSSRMRLFFVWSVDYRCVNDLLFKHTLYCKLSITESFYLQEFIYTAGYVFTVCIN